MADSRSERQPSATAPPPLSEALRWVGYRVDDMNGSRLGRVEGIFVDVKDDEPVWTVAKLGRFGKVTAIPYVDCAEGAGRIWVAHGRKTVRAAPPVDPREPLTREQEADLYGHYLVGPDRGRHADVAGRNEGAVTAKPAARDAEG